MTQYHPEYFTDAVRKAEEDFRIWLEKLTGRELKKLADRYTADFLALSGKQIIAVVEAKCRRATLAEIGDPWVGFHKFERVTTFAKRASRITGRKIGAWFFWRCSDGVYSYIANPEHKHRIEIGGMTRAPRVAVEDVEPMVIIDRKLCKRIDYDCSTTLSLDFGGGVCGIDGQLHGSKVA